MNCVAVTLTPNGSMADSRDLFIALSCHKRKNNISCNCSDYKGLLGTVHIHMGMFTCTLFFPSTFH